MTPRTALLLGIGALALGCNRPALPTLGVVPPFALTERSGKAVTDADLRDGVWIANFIFTRCPDVCPALTARMGEVRRTLADVTPPVRLVSVSVDPGHDTIDVLREYASRHAIPDDWLLVTGPRDTIAALVGQGFHLAFGDDGPATGPITHSDRFVLVDGRLRIRGYYHGKDAEDVARLVADARALANG